MNDRQLRYALAVWREHSFSKAAARLNISQPSVSEQIRTLEQEVGFKLFRRRGRGVEVTYKGRTFLHQAERAIADLHDLSATARMLRGGPLGSFRIGFSSAITHAAVPRVTAALGPTLRLFNLEVQIATTRRINRLVFEERLDVGITFDSDRRGLPPGLHRDALLPVALAALFPPHHPLAVQAAPITLADLRSEPMIANEPDLGFGEAVHAAFANAGEPPTIGAICDNMDTIAAMVMAGVGIAVVPNTLAANEVANGLLVMRPIQPALTVSAIMIRRADPHVAPDKLCMAAVRDCLMTAPEPPQLLAG